MNHIKRFQNAQAIGKNYSEDQLMHILLDKCSRHNKYSAQIASHQAELRREKRVTDQKSLSISYLQTDYLNIDISSGSGKNSERENIVLAKFTLLEVLTILFKKIKRIRKDKEKARVAGDLYKRRTQRTTCKYFKCGYEDHLISKCPKPPKDNEKRQKKSISVKGVIVHCKENSRTVITIITKIYMHLCHVSLIMTKFLVDILATVHNGPIGFQIQEQRVI